MFYGEERIALVSSAVNSYSSSFESPRIMQEPRITKMKHVKSYFTMNFSFSIITERTIEKSKAVAQLTLNIIKSSHGKTPICNKLPTAINRNPTHHLAVQNPLFCFPS